MRVWIFTEVEMVQWMLSVVPVSKGESGSM